MIFGLKDLKLDFNGMPSKLIRVYRVGNQSALAIADAVESYVDEKNKVLPMLVNPVIAPEESVTTDILKDIRAIIPVRS